MDYRPYKGLLFLKRRKVVDNTPKRRIPREIQDDYKLAVNQAPYPQGSARPELQGTEIIDLKLSLGKNVTICPKYYGGQLISFQDPRKVGEAPETVCRQAAVYIPP